MTDHDQQMLDAADKHAMAFLAMEQEAGMIKSKRLRCSQEKRMRAYVARELKKDGFGSFEIWLFVIVNLGKVIYAAWKVWQERHSDPLPRGGAT